MLDQEVGSMSTDEVPFKVDVEWDLPFDVHASISKGDKHRPFIHALEEAKPKRVIDNEERSDDFSTSLRLNQFSPRGQLLALGFISFHPRNP